MAGVIPMLPRQGLRLLCTARNACYSPRSAYASVQANTFPTAPLTQRKNSFHTHRTLSSRQDDAAAPTPGPNAGEKPAKSPEAIIKEHVQAVDHLLRASEKITYPSLNVYNIKATDIGHIKLISFNIPKTRNAISKQLLHDLGEQIEGIHAESRAGKVTVLILASEVSGAFCAGADLAERKNMSPEDVKEFLTKLRHTFKRIANVPIPSISCVSGYALGGGLELALCTHLRVFAWNAQVGLPETRLAIIPGAGGTYRLPQVVGVSKARELILDARRVKGREAYEMGLCNRIVESASPAVDENDPELARKLCLLETVNWAMSMSKQGPVAMQAAIQSLKDGGSEEAENAAYEKVLATKDRLEALAAFAEKREPRFTGE